MTHVTKISSFREKSYLLRWHGKLNARGFTLLAYSYWNQAWTYFWQINPWSDDAVTGQRRKFHARGRTNGTYRTYRWRGSVIAYYLDVRFAAPDWYTYRLYVARRHEFDKSRLAEGLDDAADRLETLRSSCLKYRDDFGEQTQA